MEKFPKEGEGCWSNLGNSSDILTLFFAIEFCGYETDLASGGTLKKDNYTIIGKPEIGTCSAVKIILEYSKKIGATEQLFLDQLLLSLFPKLNGKIKSLIDKLSICYL